MRAIIWKDVLEGTLGIRDPLPLISNNRCTQQHLLFYSRQQGSVLCARRPSGGTSPSGEALHAARTDARAGDAQGQGVVAIAGTFGDGTEEPVLKSNRQVLELGACYQHRSESQWMIDFC